MICIWCRMKSSQLKKGMKVTDSMLKQMGYQKLSRFSYHKDGKKITVEKKRVKSIIVKPRFSQIIKGF
jgi:hypothetical protein